MAGHLSRRAPRDRSPRHSVVAIAIGCSALTWASIPGALAASDHTRATSSVGASTEAAAPLHAKRVERAAQAEAVVPPPPSASTPKEGRLERPAAGRPTRGGPPDAHPAKPVTNEAPAGGTAGARRADRGGAPPRSRGRDESARSSEGAAKRGQGIERSGEGAGGTSQAFARTKKEREKAEREKAREKAQREKAREKAKKERTRKSAKPEVPQSGTESKGKAAAPVAETASVATASAPAAATASTATSAGGFTASKTAAVKSGLAASADKHARGANRRARQPKIRTAGGRATPVVAALSSPTIAATTASTGSSRPVRAAAKRTPTHAGQLPLATTITKIVGVVPTPIRILIGVLVALALALAVRSRLSSVRARRLERQRGQLLEDVGLLQAALLPVPPARLGPVGTSVAYRPADGPGAGGDFYDVFALEDGQIAVIVGDVSGHGRGALPHTALLRFTVRAYLEAGLSPRKALQTAGSVLERQLGDSFATVVAATYHPRERTLTYACAGHPPPVMLDPHAEEGGPLAPVTVCSSPPIGAGMRTGTRQTVVSVPGPSQLCFHTDGVTEARIGSDLFGAARLANSLAGLGREATASTLLDSVAAQTDARPDDMAACLLRIEDGAGAPAILLEELELDREEAASRRTERFLLACGVDSKALPAVIYEARTSAERLDTVLLELRFGDGPPTVALRHEDIFHPPALAVASAS
jgi:hypothetical protein